LLLITTTERTGTARIQGESLSMEERSNEHEKHKSIVVTIFGGTNQG
jgi:hypothetical protein